MKKQLKPGKDYTYQFITKEKGIIKTNDINDIKGLILHDKDGEAAYKEFYLNGKLYCKTHYKDDKFHNLNGASDVEYYETGMIIGEDYYIEGQYYTKEQWQQKVKQLKTK